jgi:hypothetical protein
MSDEQEQDVLVSHAYRDGKIFFTVTITTVTAQTYRINREDTGFLLGEGRSLDEAIDMADMYLLGITTGYDLEIEHASKERTKHQRTSAHQRTSYGCICGCGRSPESEGERRD